MSTDKKIGRPSCYSPELGKQICDLIAECIGLRKICAREGMPNVQTIFNWLNNSAQYPEFFDQYARAKEIQAEMMAEEIIAIADDGTNDTYEDEEGNKRTDNDVVQRSKLRIEARKWAAAKLLPKKYGDRMTINNETPVDCIKVEIINATEPKGE